MSKWTPTTEQVRDAFAIEWDYDAGGYSGKLNPDDAAAFDRWLAAHDAHVKADALRDAAEIWLRGAWAATPHRADRAADRISAAQFAGDWMKDRADKIESEMGHE